VFITRLKPELRATLVEQGHVPEQVWISDWSRLIQWWSVNDGQGADELSQGISVLPARTQEDEQQIGTTLLRLLDRLVARRPTR
jgi:hypothetical protein